MTQPLITVVIPVHNHCRWVNEAIDSVIFQDYPNKRIVVVDDGSTDDSYGVVARRLENAQSPPHEGEPEASLGHISGVSLLVARFTDSRGPSFARNYGIKAGWESSEAFAFLDSDDLYLPGKLATSVAKWHAAERHVGAVYSDYETFNADGIRVRQYKEPFSRERLLQECLPNMDSLVSKAAFDQCGVFDEGMRCCEDLDLWLRISERFVIVHIAECLLSIRVGDHSSTATVPNEIWRRCYARVFEKASQRIQNGLCTR